MPKVGISDMMPEVVAMSEGKMCSVPPKIRKKSAEARMEDTRPFVLELIRSPMAKVTATAAKARIGNQVMEYHLPHLFLCFAERVDTDALFGDFYDQYPNISGLCLYNIYIYWYHNESVIIDVSPHAAGR